MQEEEDEMTIYNTSNTYVSLENFSKREIIGKQHCFLHKH